VRKLVLLFALAALVAAMVACSAPPTPTPKPAPTTLPSPTAVPTKAPPTSTPRPTPTVAPLAIDALKNVEYQVVVAGVARAVKLANGVFEDKAAKLRVVMADIVGFGDLNGDGVSDAAVILATTTGSSSVLYDLDAVLNQNGAAKFVASTPLGDRVQVKSIAIQGSEIAVDLLTQGPKDPISKPTLAVTRKYRLQGDKLVSTTPATPTSAAPPTKASAPATPKPVATATPTKPPLPKGSLAYHWNDSGVDRMSVLNLETGIVTPYLVVGPVIDVTQNTNAHIGEWSPDGSKFAYIFAGALNASNILKVLDSAGNSVSLYSSDAGGGLSSPTWSPDGKRIAFARMGPNQQWWTITIINADGTQCGDKFECVNRQVQGEQYRGGVSWSKQGLLAAGFNTTGANEVYTIYADGSGARNLTNHPADDSTPVWSPDGKLIAFASNRDGRSQIYVMNADGGGLRRVSQSAFADFSPTWSPDGKWLAFASTREGQTDIYMMDLSGGNVTRLTKTGGDHPIWSR